MYGCYVKTIIRYINKIIYKLRWYHEKAEVIRPIIRMSGFFERELGTVLVQRDGSLVQIPDIQEIY